LLYAWKWLWNCMTGNTKRAGRNHCARAVVPQRELVPKAQFLDDRSVAVNVDSLHVVEEAATLSIHLEKATATVVIVLVGAKVLREVLDPLAEERDLNASRPAVGVVRPVLLDGRAFLESHVLVSSSREMRRAWFYVVA
jgi:hypothetical protein